MRVCVLYEHTHVESVRVHVITYGAVRVLCGVVLCCSSLSHTYHWLRTAVTHIERSTDTSRC